MTDFQIERKPSKVPAIAGLIGGVSVVVAVVAHYFGWF